jgi:hypothetical protein
MGFDGFGGFGCFFVVLLLLAVAGAAPGGTPYHQILMVFDGLERASAKAAQGLPACLELRSTARPCGI